MSLYQKVRFKSLDEIVGNKHTVSSLRSIVRKKNHPHVYLFYGPSGCGKTSLTRILAKEFRCDEMHVYEYNAANTRSIDDVRSISELSNVSPIGGGNKCFIIDESHQLTKAAQQCLLKVLEDYPNYCYFMLCTTEPQNLIDTIRTRCAKYELTTLNKRKIQELLNSICQKEEIKVEEELIELISLTCEGSPRNAINTLEQISNMDPLDAADFIQSGSVRDSNIIELCKLLAADPLYRLKKWKTIFAHFDLIEDDSEKVRRTILKFFLNKLKECESEELDKARNYSAMMQKFAMSTFYGGKSQLGAQIANVVFNNKENNND